MYVCVYAVKQKNKWEWEFEIPDTLVKCLTINSPLTYVCTVQRRSVAILILHEPDCNMKTIHRWNERAERNKEKWTYNQHMKTHINYKQLFRFVLFHLFVYVVCDMQHVILLKFYLRWKWINVNKYVHFKPTNCIGMRCIALHITVRQILCISSTKSTKTTNERATRLSDATNHIITKKMHSNCIVLCKMQWI